MKGEYQIDQYLENGIDVYSIKYIDEDGDIEQDDFKTDGTKSTRKKTIPTIGVQVRVDATAHCEANKLITKGKAYLLGKNVGTFNSITQKNEEGILVMQISAQYLNKNMEKLIQCAE